MTVKDVLKLNESLGTKVISLIECDPALKSEIIRLKKIFQDITVQQGFGENMALEWAYAGCISAAFNGDDPISKLQKYVENIEKILKRNPFQDAEVYVRRVYRESFM